MNIHLGSAPPTYDRTDQNVMRRTIEQALIDGLDKTASGLDDFVVEDPQNGQLLIYESGVWTNDFYYLDNLEDVLAPSPNDEDYLKFNGTYWVNERALATEVDMPSPYRTPVQTVSQAFSLQGSAGAESGGQCTAGTNPGEIDVAAGYGWLRPSRDDPDLIPIEWDAETISVDAGEFTSIGIGWTGGVPRVQWKYGNAYWDNQIEFQVGNALFDGTNTYAFDQYSYIPNAVGKVATRMLEAEDQGRAFRQGLEMEDKSYGGTDRYLSMSAGVLWDVLQRTEVPNFDSSPENPSPDFFLVLYYDASIPGFTFQTPLPHYQWDNTQWNDQTDGTTPLKPLPTDKWAVMWFTLTSDGNIVAVYPDQYHDDQASAEDAEPPNNLTDEIESQIHSKFVFQEGEANAKEVFTLWGDVGPFGPGKAPGDHGALTGLNDDDHSIYLHLNVSRQVTAQHNFTVYGTGDFLSGEWDCLFGNTTTTKFGAIAVGGAALALGGTSLSSVGTPGINLEGTVILANRGNGPQGNSEYVFGETSDEIRFGLPKSGVGLGTYNPRSMIIAGPAEFDDDIYLGTHWGFDKLPMDTGTYGADLGVQHDVQVLGKLWVDGIAASTTGGTITIDDNVEYLGTVTATGLVSVTSPDNTYLQVVSTDADSSAWVCLQNDAREYHLRVTGANELDIYDVTAAQTRLTMDTAGVFTFAQNITVGTNVIDPDSYSGTVIGTIEDGSGFSCVGIGMGNDTGKNVCIGTFGSGMYFGTQDGVSANTMGTAFYITMGDKAVYFTGAVTTGALSATTGDFSSTVAIDGQVTLGNSIIRDSSTEQLYVSGGDATNSGANLTMWGNTHATNANDWRFRSASLEVLRWDFSESLLTFGSYTWVANLTFRTVVDSGYDVTWKIGEQSDNYGWSWIYDGSGTNDLFLYRHENDAVGAEVVKFDRGTGDVFIAESLNINGGSPTGYPLYAYNATTNVVAEFVSGDATTWLSFRDNTTTASAYVAVGCVGDDLKLRAHGSDKVRLASLSFRPESAALLDLGSATNYWDDFFCDTVTAGIGAGRTVYIESGKTTINMTAGGWAGGHYVSGSAGTTVGVYGYAGSDDALSYLYIGSGSYLDALATRWYPDGRLLVQGELEASALDINGNADISGSLTVGSFSTSSMTLDELTINDAMGIGIAPDTRYDIYIDNDRSGSLGKAIFVNSNLNASANNSNSWFIDLDGFMNVGSYTGCQLRAINIDVGPSGTTNLNTFYAMYVIPSNANKADVWRGIYYQYTSSPANNYTFFGTGGIGGSGNYTYGVNLGAVTTTGTTNWGIYVGAVSGATTNYAIYTAGGTVQIFTSGLVVGNPTGGDKGTGTINVQNDIYKNNSAYTNPDYVFEHYYGQKTDEPDYEGLKPLAKVEEYLMQHLHLPRITRAQMGIFQRADTLLEKVEEVFLYLIEHEKKLDEILETIKQ